MKEVINLKDLIKGEVEVFRISGNAWESIYKTKNTLTASAPQMMARALGGEASRLIDSIAIIGSSIVLAQASTNRTFPDYTIPFSSKVQYTAIFNEASFSGSYDKLELNSSSGGLTFSQVSPLVLTKAANEQIAIIWLLTIN